MEPESQGLSVLTDAGNCSANAGKAWPETLGEVLPGTREQDGSERHREWDLTGAEPKPPPQQRQRPHTSIILYSSPAGDAPKRDAQGWTDST